MENDAMPNEDFINFLNGKNIDQKAFETGEPELFQKWQLMFGQINVESFVMQQKFLINPIRRAYPMKKFN